MGRSGGIKNNKISSSSTRQSSRSAIKKEEIEEAALDVAYKIDKELDQAKSFFSTANKQAAAEIIAKYTGEKDVLGEIERVYQDYIKELASDEYDAYRSKIESII
jgi:predicted HAD superfamily Cof-like phosphohydrolase